MKQAKVYTKVKIRNGKEYTTTSLTDLGRAEKEADEAMALVKSTKYNPAKADAFKRECKIGEYREWEWDMESRNVYGFSRCLMFLWAIPLEAETV
jgi:hypothetical protein